MLESIAESATVAWPLTLSLATVVLAGRVRTTRRREALNRALHELRRPLQALVLLGEGERRAPEATRLHLELALDALRDLDREINPGAVEARERAPADARRLAAAALERWEAEAVRRGRRLDLDWSAGDALLLCDPPRLARALDNLIVNALEHGDGTIRLRATRAAGRLRLAVQDGEMRAQPVRLEGSRRGPRRGHGLAIAGEIAAEHGGRLRIAGTRGGVEARIELPIAG